MQIYFTFYIIRVVLSKGGLVRGNLFAKNIMDKKYIKGFVFGVVCITQFMQCTVLTNGLHMGKILSTIFRSEEEKKNTSITKAGQAQQAYIKLLCVDFYSLFKRAKSDVEDCVNIYLPKSLTSSAIWNTKYATNEGYSMISFDDKKPDPDPSIVLKLEYSGSGIEHIDPAVLNAIRNSLYRPKEFKNLIVDCLEKDYKVVIFASIKYPHFIPIVLQHVIGFDKDKLSNVCIVWNGQDANGMDQPYEHIKFAERLMGLRKDQVGRGLVVSSSLGNAVIDLSSNIDYILYGIALEKSSGLSAASSYWSNISTFEEQRYRLIQKAQARGWTTKALNNQIWDVAKKRLKPYNRLEHWSSML